MLDKHTHPRSGTQITRSSATTTLPVFPVAPVTRIVGLITIVLLLVGPSGCGRVASETSNGLRPRTQH